MFQTTNQSFAGKCRGLSLLRPILKIIPSPVHIKHPPNGPNGMWKFPLLKTMGSLNGGVKCMNGGWDYPAIPVLLLAGERENHPIGTKLVTR